MNSALVIEAFTFVSVTLICIFAIRSYRAR